MSSLFSQHLHDVRVVQVWLFSFSLPLSKEKMTSINQSINKGSYLGIYVKLVFIFIDRLIRLSTPEVSSSQGVFRGVTEHSPWDTAVTDGIGMPPAGTPVPHLVQHMPDMC